MQILIVDDEPEWLGLLIRLFPDHIVDAVQSFVEARKRVEAPGQHYDVAIVDLNLINDHRNDDRLGGEILGWLYQNSRSTRRIAVTGTPAGSVRREVLDKYHVEDLFIKGGRRAELRELALGPPSGPAPDISEDPALETLRSELRENIQAVKATVLGNLNQQIAEQQNDLKFSGRQRSGGDEAKLEDQLGRLRSLQDAFARECGVAEAVLDGMSNTEDGEAAAQVVRKFTDRWKAR
jgi:CheY-like chemotaxis protein